MLIIAIGLAGLVIVLGSAALTRQAETLVEELLDRAPLLDERWHEPPSATANRRRALIRALGASRVQPSRSHRDYACYSR